MHWCILYVLCCREISILNSANLLAQPCPGPKITANTTLHQCPDFPVPTTSFTANWANGQLQLAAVSGSYGDMLPQIVLSLNSTGGQF